MSVDDTFTLMLDIIPKTTSLPKKEIPKVIIIEALESLAGQIYIRDKLGFNYLIWTSPIFLNQPQKEALRTRLVQNGYRVCFKSVPETQWEISW